jgi:tetratricopeptide (TPR) repeat protein
MPSFILSLVLSSLLAAGPQADPPETEDQALARQTVAAYKAWIEAREAGDVVREITTAAERARLIAQRYGADYPLALDAEDDVKRARWIAGLAAPEQSRWFAAQREWLAADELVGARDYTAAVVKLQRAITEMEAITGTDHLWLAGPLYLLGGALSRGIRHAEALAARQRRLAILRRQLPPDDVRIEQAVLEHDAIRALLIGDGAALPALAERCLSYLRRCPAAAVHDGYVLHMLGVALQRQGKVELAEAAYRRAVQSVEREDAASQRSLTHYLIALARICLDQNRFDEAHDLTQRALREEERLVRDPRARHVPLNLSDMLLAQEKPDAALAVLADLRTLHADRAATDPDTWVVILQNIAVCYSRKNEIDAARRAGEEALAFARDNYGAGHVRTGRQLVNLGSIASSSRTSPGPRRCWPKRCACFVQPPGNGPMRRRTRDVSWRPPESAPAMSTRPALSG